MSDIDESALVESGVSIGEGTKIWSNAQIRTGAVIGSNCVIGRNVFIDLDVHLGHNVKVQNNASLFEGVTIEDGVFVGPSVIFTNDRVPRAINPNGGLKDRDDWVLGSTLLRHGASVGAGAVIVTGVTIGRWAMIGSGSVVTRDVEDHELVVGNPARPVGFVSAGGRRFDTQAEARTATTIEQTVDRDEATQ